MQGKFKQEPVTGYKLNAENRMVRVDFVNKQTLSFPYDRRAFELFKEKADNQYKNIAWEEFLRLLMDAFINGHINLPPSYNPARFARNASQAK